MDLTAVVDLLDKSKKLKEELESTRAQVIAYRRQVITLETKREKIKHELSVVSALIGQCRNDPKYAKAIKGRDNEV